MLNKKIYILVSNFRFFFSADKLKGCKVETVIGKEEHYLRFERHNGNSTTRFKGIAVQERKETT